MSSNRWMGYRASIPKGADPDPARLAGVLELRINVKHALAKGWPPDLDTNYHFGRKVVCTLDNLLSTVMPAKVEISRIAARSAIAA
ncbi:hypothetical protein PG984_012190 [Apiospora sp. TS-2023a]